MRYRLLTVLVAVAMTCVGLSVAVSINTAAVSVYEGISGVPWGSNFEPMDIAVGRMAGLQDPTGAMFTVIRSDPRSQG